MKFNFKVRIPVQEEDFGGDIANFQAAAANIFDNESVPSTVKNKQYEDFLTQFRAFQDKTFLPLKRTVKCEESWKMNSTGAQRKAPSTTRPPSPSVPDLPDSPPEKMDESPRQPPYDEPPTLPEKPNDQTKIEEPSVQSSPVKMEPQNGTSESSIIPPKPRLKWDPLEAREKRLIQRLKVIKRQRQKLFEMTPHAKRRRLYKSQGNLPGGIPRDWRYARGYKRFQTVPQYESKQPRMEDEIPPLPDDDDELEEDVENNLEGSGVRKNILLPNPCLWSKKTLQNYKRQ